MERPGGIRPPGRLADPAQGRTLLAVEGGRLRWQVLQNHLTWKKERPDIQGEAHGAVFRSCAEPPQRGSPERVWTLLVLPLESLPTALTLKGAGGEGQHGRRPMLVLSMSGWLLFRMAAREPLGDVKENRVRALPYPCA
jgi:hypothetical protein